MPPDHHPDDEDTQEHSQPPDYRNTAHEPAATGPPQSPDWSSQAGGQPAPWQQPASPASQWPEQPEAEQQPPQVGWQPQQPQAGWPQQPQAGWQQQPQWQPQQGWGQPGYWPAAPEYPNNPLVVVAGIILVVFGVLATLIGLFGMVVGSFAATLIEEYLPPEAALEFDFRAFATFLLLIFGIILVVGILHFLSAIGIFMHKGWARAIGIVLAVLGLLLGVVGAVGVAQAAVSAAEAGSEAVVPVIVAISYGLTLFALIAGGNHFRRRYG